MTEPIPDWWVKALADFGAGMGFREAGGWRSDVLNLSVEGGRCLVDVERCGDEIVLALLCRAPRSEVREKALFLMRRCGVESYLPFVVQVGLKGDDVLVLAARIERAEAYRMQNAFKLLLSLYADAGL
ncbi:MAG: hypothetical protein OXQ29_11640 [Rhodospirillaceae bacterium]|nr:hypothetical protein [Rhodospirillaceae bacterium]